MLDLVLRRHRVFGPGSLLGLHQGLRQTFDPSLASRIQSGAGKEETMDFIIAGIVSLGLFVYLLYALLRPEKF